MESVELLEPLEILQGNDPPDPEVSEIVRWLVGPGS
jgi:hypothetical protein